MAYTTIGGITLQGNWPSTWGTSGTLGIFCTQNFTADDGQAFQVGDGESLTGEFVTKATISVTANVGTVTSFLLPKTDAGTPISTRYFGRVFTSTGAATESYPFSDFHLRTTLGDSISYLQWWLDNQQHITPQPDGAPSTSAMNLAIAAAIDNAALNQDYVIGSYSSFAVAVAAMPITGATLVINQATSVPSNISVPSYVILRFTGKGYLNFTDGATLTYGAQFIEAGPHKIFSNALAGHGTVTGLSMARPEWWTTNTTPGTTDMTGACVAAETALSSGGGRLILEPTTYLVTSWTPIRTGMVVQGAGQNVAIIKGSGAGSYTVRFSSLARTRWSNLAIDGGEIKTAAMTMVGSSSSNVFDNVRWKGGTTNSLVLGVAGSSADDIADNTWLAPVIQSDNCSGAQLLYRGNNVSSNVIVGGRISTGGSNILGMRAIDMDDGATLRIVCVNLLGDSAVGTYVVTKTSGVLQVFGGHVEANAFIHTLSTDPRTDDSTPPDILEGVSLATSGTDTIYHEAPRTMIVTGCRSGGNIKIGTAARLIGKGNGFASASSYVREGNAELVADDAAKGSDVLSENNKLSDTLLFSVASAASKVSGLWLFDEDGSTTTITDRGTLSHDLTLSSAANLLTPKNRGFAPSLLFSQSPSNYWSTPDHNDFSFGDGATDTPFTFIFVVQPTSLGATINTLFGKYNSSTSSGEYLLSMNSAKLTILLNDQSTGGTIGRLYNTSLSADVDNVHVYAATYSGSSLATGIKLYRDGVRVDDTDNSSGAYTAMENTTDVPGNFTFAPGRLVGNARNFGCVIVKEEWTAAQVLRVTKLMQAHVAKS